jgi:hypothetical protein
VRGEPLLSRLAPPKGRLGVVLGHTQTLVVRIPEEKLRLGVALLSHLASTGYRLCIVLLSTFAVYERPPKVDLRIGLALIRREVHRLSRYSSALPLGKYLFKCLF